ncbi:MAG: sigma-70 family RNA polymerase sigma factor [Gemmatimonadaceae bacterium]
MSDSSGQVDRSFEENAIAFIDDVARFAYSLARDTDEADDLVQDTYLRAIRARHTWRDGGNMRAWLFTICKNIFLTGKTRMHESVSIDDDAGEETLAAARLHNDLVAAGEGDLFDRIDVGPAIQRALKDLLPVFRTVVVLVDMEGYAYGEAADALGVPIGTVRSRLFRARRLMQEHLRDHAHDAGVPDAVNSSDARPFA